MGTGTNPTAQPDICRQSGPNSPSSLGVRRTDSVTDSVTYIILYIMTSNIIISLINHYSRRLLVHIPTQKKKIYIYMNEKKPKTPNKPNICVIGCRQHASVGLPVVLCPAGASRVDLRATHALQHRLESRHRNRKATLGSRTAHAREAPPSGGGAVEGRRPATTHHDSATDSGEWSSVRLHAK